MARLHEYQGKQLLRKSGVPTPDGSVARTPHEARAIAQQLGASSGSRVVLKVQAWTTSRAAQGGIVFVNSPDDAEMCTRELLAKTFGNFSVREVLVERAIEIDHELFVSLSIDDAARSPVLLIDAAGGSGIEDRAASVARIPVECDGGFNDATLRGVLTNSPIAGESHDAVVDAVKKIITLARTCEARSFEVNPLVVTKDGHPTRVVAADCRVTIDDYAVFRHPELGIEIARELDHPPTELERIAYAVEEADHRGTFYFAQLEETYSKEGKGSSEETATSRRPLIGFHGAGGGGSMMSMDAVSNVGFTLANFCDTSGNPSAAKVYRAARIILSQPGLVGYFGSGSGVASQEQFWSAYGLAKAFVEVNLSIPAVIRLGGNSEDRAVEILEDACRDLPADVEGYKKDDTPQFCAERLAELVDNPPLQLPGAGEGRGESDVGGTGLPPIEDSNEHSRDACTTRHVPAFVGSESAYSFSITGGRVWIDHASCDEAGAETVVKHSSGLLRLNEFSKPVAALSEEKLAGKDSELIACEIECRRAGLSGGPVVFVDLKIPGLE